MTISQQHLDELADELRDRTNDFINEEVWQLLYDNEYITETDDNAVILIHKVLHNFYHPNLTKVFD